MDVFVSVYDLTSILEYEGNGPAPIAPELKTVSATDSIGETLYIMSRNNYSQIGVEKDGSLSGVVSYRSVVETQLVLSEMDGYNGEWFELEASIVITDAEELPRTADILDLFEHLTDNAYAIVEAEDGSYHIITDYDLMTFITESLLPFLQIEEIETSLRTAIRSVYENPDDKVKKVTERIDERVRTVDGVDDCSFIHYEMIIGSGWEDGFSDIFLREKKFTVELIKHVRRSRNDIFHFKSSDRSQKGLLELDLATRHLHEATERIE